MSGEQYYFCPKCYEQWEVDPDNDENWSDTKCLSCDVPGYPGDLGDEGTLAYNIIQLVNDFPDGVEFLQKVFDKYFELDNEESLTIEGYLALNEKEL